MTEKIKITSKGQITIPKIFREEIKLKKGMYLSAFVQEGNLVLKPLPEENDKARFINYAHEESRGCIGISKVREMSKDFNLNMAEQVREIREPED